MKKPVAKKPGKKFVIPLIALLIAAVSVPYIWAHWLRESRQEAAVKNTLTTEMKPLLGPLQSIGFDASKTDASCQRDGDEVRYCEASVNIYTVIHSDPASLHTSAAQLSGLLNENGWQQREDYPTITWFDAIGKGVDYQPDQLNTKSVGDIVCTLDFYTSFSKPAPAAVTMRAYCSKGHQVINPLD